MRCRRGLIEVAQTAQVLCHVLVFPAGEGLGAFRKSAPERAPQDYLPTLQQTVDNPSTFPDALVLVVPDARHDFPSPKEKRSRAPLEGC